MFSVGIQGLKDLLRDKFLYGIKQSIVENSGYVVDGVPREGSLPIEGVEELRDGDVVARFEIQESDLKIMYEILYIYCRNSISGEDIGRSTQH